MGICRHGSQRDRSLPVPSVFGHLCVCCTCRRRFYLSGDPQAVNIISEATGTSNTAALARRRLRSILGFWGDSFLHGHLAIRKAPKMVGSCLRYLSPLELDPHYVPIVWLLGGILLFRSRHRNYTRHLESFRRTKVSYHIEPCPSTRNRPG